MKQLFIDSISKTKEGILQVKMKKFSSDGDFIGNQTIGIEPGSDIAFHVGVVDSQMTTVGFNALSSEDTEWIHREAAATWTPENIAPVTAKVQEAIKEQQAAINEAATKKAEAEAAANKEIEDAKAREVAANEAKALAEAAEAAAKEAQAKADAAKAASDAALKAAQDAANALAAQEKAAAEKAAFDKAVADAVAKLAPVEVAAVDTTVAPKTGIWSSIKSVVGL